MGGTDLAHLFKELDIDHSGTLDSDEFKRALRRAKIPKKDFSDARLDEAFKMIDKDKSKAIEMSEFFEWCDEVYKSTQSGGEGKVNFDAVEQMLKRKKKAMAPDVAGKTRATNAKK